VAGGLLQQQDLLSKLGYTQALCWSVENPTAAAWWYRLHSNRLSTTMRRRDPLPDTLQTRKGRPSLDVAERLRYLRFVVVAGYLAGILLSRRLWFGAGRTFPRAPVVSGMPPFILVHDYLLSILLVAALALSLLSKQPRRYLVAVVALTALLALFDLSRLQPWVYQYVLMLAVLACYATQRRDRPAVAQQDAVLGISQLIIAMLYFWSGAQKLNWSFAHEVIPGLLESANIHLSSAFLSYLPTASLGLALGEASIGIAFLISRTRLTALILALVMHIVVLVLLIATSRNSVVWTWNLAMMAMVILLFWREDHSLWRGELWQWRSSNLTSYIFKVVIALSALAPALSFAGYWDMYLSSALYSGNTLVGVVRVGEQTRSRLPLAAQGQIFTTGGGESMLPYYEWSVADLNVPPYPESRVFRQIARQLCAYEDQPRAIELIVRERPALLDGTYSVTRTQCQDLSSR
jgi:hypothetical protein